MALFPNKSFEFFTGFGDYRDNAFLYLDDYRYHFDMSFTYGYQFSGVPDVALCDGVFKSFPLNYKSVFIQDIIVNTESFFVFLSGGASIMLRNFVQPTVYGKMTVLLGTGSDCSSIVTPPAQPFFPDAMNDFYKRNTYNYRVQIKPQTGDNTVKYPINEKFKLESVKNFLNIGFEYCLGDATLNNADFTRYVTEIEQQYFMFLPIGSTLFSHTTFISVTFNGRVE